MHRCSNRASGAVRGKSGGGVGRRVELLENGHVAMLQAVGSLEIKFSLFAFVLFHRSEDFLVLLFFYGHRKLFPFPRSIEREKKGAGRGLSEKQSARSSSHVTNNAGHTWIASTVRRVCFYRSDLWPFSIELEYFTQRKVYCSTACDGISIYTNFRFCCNSSSPTTLRCPLPSESNALRRCYLRAMLRNRVCGSTCKLHVCIVEHIERRARECSLPERLPRGEVHP